MSQLNRDGDVANSGCRKAQSRVAIRHNRIARDHNDVGANCDITIVEDRGGN